MSLNCQFNSKNILESKREFFSKYPACIYFSSFRYNSKVLLFFYIAPLSPPLHWYHSVAYLNFPMANPFVSKNNVRLSGRKPTSVFHKKKTFSSNTNFITRFLHFPHKIVTHHMTQHSKITASNTTLHIRSLVKKAF